jgi:hypothetical protein
MNVPRYAPASPACIFAEIVQFNPTADIAFPGLLPQMVDGMDEIVERKGDGTDPRRLK